MSETVVIVERSDRVATITMNRPARRNAINGELAAALDAAVKEVAADDSVRVVVLTGAAPEGRLGGFCSGGDTSSGDADRAGMEFAVPSAALDGDLARHDAHAAMSLHLMPKPTIAMIGGPAVGAGCSLAAACDLRFASDDAVLMAGFMPNGLAGDYGGSFLWTRIAGTAVARRLYLMNERLDARRALALGLVHEVLAPAELHAYTMSVAKSMARVPANLLALVKDNLNEAEDERGRRRFLFAAESVNQHASASASLERMRRLSGPTPPAD